MKMTKVPIEEARRFMEDCLIAVGVPEPDARSHADLLLHADLTGHFSHGMNRLPFYINDVQTEATDALAKPVILNESAATAWVDGANGLGAAVGNFCMNLAIKKAKEAGVGLVSVKRCCHFGMAGYWAGKALREGLIGLAFTNSSPLLVPTRSKQRALGTNPIALFAPATDGDFLGVDMASTAVAMGKIEVQVHKEEPIPLGWALGPDGEPTTDAQLAFNTGRLMPLGGGEETCGYKGYALSAAFEVLCGGLSGGNCSYQTRGWSKDTVEGPPNMAQCFMAIDPRRFAPGFEERISGCLNTWRDLEPVDPSLPVLAPGDKERANMERTQEIGTIAYAQNMLDEYEELAQKLSVKPIQVVQ